jgi:hypothetical protein
MPRPHSVEIPDPDIILWRMLESDDTPPEAFMSFFELHEPRRWTTHGEDAARHRGISMWRTRELVISQIRSLDRPGRPTKWTHVAAVRIRGDEGHAVAQVGKKGHYTVWAEAEVLCMMVVEVRAVSE